MANPYFNAAYYLATNLDVLAAGYTVETAEQHYLQYGAAEALSGANTARKPAPWFDIQFYLTSNPDLLANGIGADNAFWHFTTYGQFEQRSPANGLTVTDAKLKAYADANEDLRTAFGITDTANLTDAQKDALTSHFYQYGYAEDRAGSPFDTDTNPGETFTLTTGIDTLTGTSGDDTFIATNNATAALSTLNLGDSANGGAGVDTLNVISNGAGALAGSFKSIEVINVNQATGVAAATLVASSQAADATNINMTGAGAVTVTGLGANQQVGMIGAATAGGNAAAFTVTQTTNGPLTLNLNGAVGSAAAGNLTFVDAGAATAATINATGTASTLQGVTLPGARTLAVNADVNVTLGGITDAALTTVTAAGAATTVNLGALNSTVVSSIDASGLTAGGASVTLANGNLNNVTFVGGAGNDTINLGTNIIAGAVGQLNAGDGSNDTLGLTLGAQLTAALAPAYVGFERLSLAGTTNQTFNVANLAGITDVTVAGSTGVTATVNGLTALTPQAITATGVGALTLGVTNATTVGTNDTVSLTLSSTQNAVATIESLSIAGVETLNLTAATGTGLASVSALTNAGNLSALNITGDASPVTFTTGANAIGANLTVTSTGTGVHTINFSGATGNGVSITSGAGNDILTGSAQNDSINGGAGNDTITGGNGADVLTGGAGNDNFVYAAVAQSAASVAADTVRTFDSITDFTTFQDKVVLTGVNAALTGGAVATSIAVSTLTTGAGSLNDTTIASFAELKTAIDAVGLTASAAGGALQAYVIDLSGNTGALGTGKYLLVNNNDAAMTAADVMIQLTGTSVAPVAADFTL